MVLKTKSAKGLAGSVSYLVASLQLNTSDCSPSIEEGRKERVTSKNSANPMGSGTDDVARIGTRSPAKTAVRTPAIISSAEIFSPFK